MKVIHGTAPDRREGLNRESSYKLDRGFVRFPGWLHALCRAIVEDGGPESRSMGGWSRS
jgi:hypothetical protein